MAAMQRESWEKEETEQEAGLLYVHPPHQPGFEQEEYWKPDPTIQTTEEDPVCPSFYGIP